MKDFVRDKLHVRAGRARPDPVAQKHGRFGGLQFCQQFQLNCIAWRETKSVALSLAHIRRDSATASQLRR